jgi:dipeptidyl aminopeptidase/acylaminoacyl peptidase
MHPILKCLGALACCALSLASLPVRADDAGVLRVAVAAERARAPAPRIPRDAFLAPPAHPAVRLSPDGRHVAYLRAQGEQRSLWLLPTAGGPARQVLPRTEATALSWSRDGRWLFVESQRSLATVGVDGRAGIRLPLRGVERRVPMRVDPSQPAAMLLRERVRTPAGEGWRLVRVDVRGRRTSLHEGRPWIVDAAIDARGRLAALLRFEGEHDVLYRVDAGGRLRQVQRWDQMARGSLLAALPTGDLLLRGNAGGDFVRVLRLDANNGLHTVHEDPRGEADLDEVALDPTTQQPTIASYRSTVAATYGLGPAQAHVATLQRRFPRRDLGIEIASGPQASWLVSERDSTLRDPRWHLYDPRSGRVRRILDRDAKQRMPGAALARKIPLAYTASDGMRVHGFLLLPPGADPKRVPLVAQVHGGPINHFRAGYDGIAQLLANRGYAVFQTNFRGSTGHGREYVLAPRGDYGNGRVQQDIVEGVRWLLAQDIGDAERVGIVGHSFGGYSALVGVTFQPELFKVGVAGAPPADLAWSMRWLLDSGDQGARPDRSLKAQLRLLSFDPQDPATYARLHAQSPLVGAPKLRRPLLLLAGGEDRTVPIREVVHYAAELRRLGKPVTLYVEADGGHSPTDLLPREAYVYLMEAMLHAHLRGAAPQPPGARLREYLQNSVRLAGPEFAQFARRR